MNCKQQDAFVKIKHCIQRIKQNKIDDIIVWKALASVCLFIFSHKRVCSRKAIDSKARDEERAFWTKFLQNFKPKGPSPLYPFDIYTTSDQTDNRSYGWHRIYWYIFHVSIENNAYLRLELVTVMWFSYFLQWWITVTKISFVVAMFD